MRPSDYKKMTFEDKWLKHAYTKSCKKRMYPFYKRFNRKRFRRITKGEGDNES